MSKYNQFWEYYIKKVKSSLENEYYCMDEECPKFNQIIIGIKTLKYGHFNECHKIKPMERTVDNENK